MLSGYLTWCCFLFIIACSCYHLNYIMMIKNVILLFVLIALLSGSSFAQGALYGVKGGINVATISGDPDITGVSLGFHVGRHATVGGSACPVICELR